MSDDDTCRTLDEAWGLVAHYIGNRLMPVGLNIEYQKEDLAKGDLENAEDLKQTNVRLHRDLVENLTPIVRKVEDLGFTEDAEKIRQILDAVVAINLENADTVKKATDLHEKLNPQRKAFRETMARFYNQTRK